MNHQLRADELRKKRTYYLGKPENGEYVPGSSALKFRSFKQDDKTYVARFINENTRQEVTFRIPLSKLGEVVFLSADHIPQKTPYSSSAQLRRNIWNKMNTQRH